VALPEIRSVFSIYDELPLSVRPTYFYNVRAAIFGGVSMGIGGMLGNIAAKVLGASEWELALYASVGGAGMLMAFFWGGVAQRRRKMPMVFWPSVISASIFFLLGLVTESWLFCLLAGLIDLVGNVGAPARAGILSANYPARIRGMITGFVSRWAMLIAAIVGFAGSKLVGHPDYNWTYKGLLPLGGFCALVAAFIYVRIRVRGENRLEEAEAEDEAEPATFRPFAALQVLRSDRRFRTYMIDFFIFGLANLMLSPVIPIVLRDDLGADLNAMQITTSIIPQVLGVLTIGLWGRVLDRSNPIVMRGWMNMVWALLPVCYFLAFLVPRTDLSVNLYFWRWAVPMPLLVVWVGSFFQGVVASGQGLVWTLGAMYFARKEDVPLYQGVHIGLTGVRSLGGAFLGPVMVAWFGGGAEGRQRLFLFVTLAMVLSGLLMFKLAVRMRREAGGRLPSIAEREAQETDAG